MRRFTINARPFNAARHSRHVYAMFSRNGFFRRSEISSHPRPQWGEKGRESCKRSLGRFGDGKFEYVLRANLSKTRKREAPTGMPRGRILRRHRPSRKRDRHQRCRGRKTTSSNSPFVPHQARIVRNVGSYSNKCTDLCKEWQNQGTE